MRRLALIAALPCFALLPLSGTAEAQVLDIITAPKTLVDRAIEARSADDILEDNRIVAEINKIMVDIGTIQASTEIYEQRLLITGLFNDKKDYEKFREAVKNVKGVKKLFWHVDYMPEKEEERRKEAKELLDWKDALSLDIDVGLALVGTRGVADVNFRVAVDASSNVYLLGRARSKPELDKAVKVARETKGVKKLYNYAFVRP